MVSVHLRAAWSNRSSFVYHQKTEVCEAKVGRGALASRGKALQPRSNECRERIRTIIERSLTGKARFNAPKDRVAKTKRVNEKKKERGLSEVQGDVRVEPRDEEQMTDWTCGRTWREENRQQMKNNLTNWGRQYDLSKKLQVHRRPQPYVGVSWISCEWWETRSAGARTCAECRSCWRCHTKVLRWMSSTRWMDERIVASKKCWIGIVKKMSEIRKERIEWVCWEHINSQRTRWENLKNEKSWKSEESNQNMVVNAKLVKNSVMDGKIREELRWLPKLIQRLWWIHPYTKLVDGTVCNPLIKILLEEFIDETEPWLLIGILNRDPSLRSQHLERHSVVSYQHMKKLMSPRAGILLIVIGCMNIQDDTHRGENPRWGNLQKKQPRTSVEDLCADGTFRRCMSMYVKQRVSPQTAGEPKIDLESYFEVHAQEVWERNWMTLEMQPTLLNTYPPKLIATILKALREWPVECGWRDCGPSTRNPSWVRSNLERRRKILGWCQRWYLSEDLVVAARREEIYWVHSEGVYEIVPMQECRDAGMKPLDLIWGGHRQVCGSESQENSIEVVCKNVQNEEARKDSTTSTNFSIVLCNATSRSCDCACLNHDVGEFVEQLETIKVETLRHQPSTFHQRLKNTRLPAEDRQKFGEDKVGRLI